MDTQKNLHFDKAPILNGATSVSHCYSCKMEDVSVTFVHIHISSNLILGLNKVMTTDHECT